MVTAEEVTAAAIVEGASWGRTFRRALNVRRRVLHELEMGGVVVFLVAAYCFVAVIVPTRMLGSFLSPAGANEIG